MFNSISDIPKVLCSLEMEANSLVLFDIECNKVCGRINYFADNLIRKGSTCFLTGSQIFYCGGAFFDGEGVRTCFILDIKTQTIEYLNPGRPRLYAVPVYFENFIYLFGGYEGMKDSTSFCDKLNLRKNKWKQIVNLPTNASQTSTVVFEKTIFVVGAGLTHLLSYNHFSNSFLKYFAVDSSHWKNIFVGNDRCHLISSDGKYYQSGMRESQVWNYEGAIVGFNFSNSSCIYHENSVYFMGYQLEICKFDFDLRRVERIGKIKYISAE